MLVAGALGVAYVVVAMAIARGSGTTTTYAGHSALAAWCFASAGIALVAAGVATGRTRSSLGALAIVAGVVWFAPVWEGWEGGPALARTVGMLAASFVFPVLVHLVLAAAERPLSRAAVVVIGLTYLLIGGCAVTVMLIRDPYYDPYCWANCTTNRFVVSSRPELARQVGDVQWWFTAIGGAGFAVVCVARLVKAFTAGPRRYWEVLPGGVVLGFATVAHVVLLRRHRLEDPDLTTFATVFVVRCGAVLLIAAGLAAALVQARRQRRTVAQIVATLGETPPVGPLDVALARAVGDPTLRIFYWLPAAGHYVDADGHHRPDPTIDNGCTATPLVRNGQTIAVIAHRSDPTEIERGLGPAARLALDNERLQAESLARMDELVESRKRIVEAGDARRSALERDLHDGAQQSLLAMSYDLQRARRQAADCGGELTDLVDSATAEVRTAFQELRDLAHGIYPAVLGAAGLCPALAALTDSRAQVRVQVDCSVTRRLPASIETAAYLVVARVIEAANTASRVTVAVTYTGDTVVVEITHDAADLPIDLGYLADRVGAVGGHLDTMNGKLTATLPCES